MDDNSVFFKTDCASILSQIKDHDKQIRLKRRSLLLLPLLSFWFICVCVCEFGRSNLDYSCNLVIGNDCFDLESALLGLCESFNLYCFSKKKFQTFVLSVTFTTL